MMNKYVPKDKREQESNKEEKEENRERKGEKGCYSNKVTHNQ